MSEKIKTLSIVELENEGMAEISYSYTVGENDVTEIILESFSPEPFCHVEKYHVYVLGKRKHTIYQRAVQSVCYF